MDQLRLLVIEDEPTSQLLVSLIAKKLGHEARVLSSGTEALRVLDDENFDVALIDISLPDMNGLDVIRRIRSHVRSEVRSMAALAMTAYSSESDKEKSFAAGFDAHLSKPFRREEFEQTIDRLLFPRSFSHRPQFD